MIHPVISTSVQRARQEVSTIMHAPQAGQERLNQSRAGDEESMPNGSDANNQSVMPLVVNADDTPIIQALAVSVMNTARPEPHLEFRRGIVVNGIRDLAMLWTALCGNLVLLLYYDIPMYLFLALLVLSEYITAIRIRNLIVKR